MQHGSDQSRCRIMSSRSRQDVREKPGGILDFEHSSL